MSNINLTSEMSSNQTKPKCFIIMPISDQESYEKGHFSRVYQHLIKPACESAGFEAVRADDEIKTNYIVVDIIKKILDSDIVICDLSAKNPNVLYELGIRQAFNKKSILIKDKKTNRIFDIQGIRTIDYDENLRIDEVQKGISLISKTLKETYESDINEINSLIQLLSISPAERPANYEISQESKLIFDLLGDISKKINSSDFNLKNIETSQKYYDINEEIVMLGTDLYNNGANIGKLLEVHADGVIVQKGYSLRKIYDYEEEYQSISSLPF